MFESSFSGGKFDLLEEMGERGVEPIKGALRAGRRDAIPVTVRHALDEAVEPEAPQVVGHGARAIRGRIAALELRDVIAQLPMPKAGGREGEETERVHERVDAGVAEAETGGPLVLDENGGGDGVEVVFADQAVVA